MVVTVLKTAADSTPTGPLRRIRRAAVWWSTPAAWILAAVFLLPAVFDTHTHTSKGGWGSLGAWIGTYRGGSQQPFPSGRALHVGFGGPDRPFDGDTPGFFYNLPFVEAHVGIYPAYDDGRHVSRILFVGNPFPRPTGPGPGRWKVSLFLGPVFFGSVALAWAASRWGWAASRGRPMPWRNPRPGHLAWRLLRPWVWTAATLAAGLLTLTNSFDLGRSEVGFRMTPPSSVAVLKTDGAGPNWPGRRFLQVTWTRPVGTHRRTWWCWTDLVRDAAPRWSAGSRRGTWFLGRYATRRGHAAVAAVALGYLAIPPALLSAWIGWRVWRPRHRGPGSPSLWECPSRRSCPPRVVTP